MQLRGHVELAPGPADAANPEKKSVALSLYLLVLTVR